MSAAKSSKFSDAGKLPPDFKMISVTVYNHFTWFMYITHSKELNVIWFCYKDMIKNNKFLGVFGSFFTL